MAHRSLRIAAATAAVTVGLAGTAFAVSVGGGDWTYGTNVFGTAWSNYYHPRANHGSSVMVNSNVVRSQCMPGGQTAQASKFRLPWDGVSYYWRYC